MTVAFSTPHIVHEFIGQGKVLFGFFFLNFF